MLEWELQDPPSKTPANLTLFIKHKGCKSKLLKMYFQGLTTNWKENTVVLISSHIHIQTLRDMLSSHQIQTKSGSHLTDLISASLLVASITLVTLSLQAILIALIASNSMTIKMVVVPPPSCLHTTDLLPT